MIDPDIQALLDDFGRRFPAILERWRGVDDVMTTSRMEAFAALTTVDLGKDDPRDGAAQLAYMSARLRSASAKEREYIDAYYVEALFFEASDRAIERGWPLVPANLKQLYIAFHGGPPLTRAERAKQARKAKRK